MAINDAEFGTNNGHLKIIIKTDDTDRWSLYSQKTTQTCASQRQEKGFWKAPL